ncbi:MAG: class I SAM-dependent methyltransferase [Deltaproteobacteria bacterium]|nr:class I SAM-dependent methyltransferase [Deltaproteobacteria bacterium]
MIRPTQRYRAHLARLVEPLCARVAAGRRGRAADPRGRDATRALDYGAGPTPALTALLRERGHEVAVYDPIYAPDEAALARTYDLVACCEVAEHFRAPARDFAVLARRLAPGGWLGVMTRLLAGPEHLPGWWYARDPTHVSFYQPRTMQWLARRFGWALEAPGPDVTLFHAP